MTRFLLLLLSSFALLLGERVAGAGVSHGVGAELRAPVAPASTPAVSAQPVVPGGTALRESGSGPAPVGFLAGSPSPHAGRPPAARSPSGDRGPDGVARICELLPYYPNAPPA